MTDEKEFFFNTHLSNRDRLEKAYKALATGAGGVSVTDLAKRMRVHSRTILRWFTHEIPEVREVYAAFCLIDNRVYTRDHALRFLNSKIKKILGKKAQIIIGD